MAFGLGAEPQTVAVYDLGGGTFDLSILSVKQGLFRVKVTAGDTHLGGDDFDIAIINWMKESFECEHRQPLPVKDNVMIRARLREEAERAKISLSTATENAVRIQDLHSKEGRSFGLDITLTRLKLEELIQPFIQRTLEICDQAMAKAALNKDDIQQVLLVGDRLERSR